ncbi:DUF4190 domain-containing protein [Microbacterium sp. Kw_RZR3]|uniref:DUF4190 domain-containing protein n=1 Tax=Microbacterium sp. Kw_RZR3 TaxID=3032903 RepID=UPI0023DC00F7|nr:DUF4190 domain-containing protein [Microbacterium sp. Kw_RZR3]MDF2046331.1 DUF4190 domain-containing protein [Microbacterium sp. Kw_RZR3]
MSDNSTQDPNTGETGATSGIDAPSTPEASPSSTSTDTPQPDASSTSASNADAAAAGTSTAPPLPPAYGAPTPGDAAATPAPPAYPAPATDAPPASGSTGYGAPATDAAPAYGATPYGTQGYPAPAYGTAAYGAQGYAGYGTQGYGSYAATARTNVLAIISLVASIAGFVMLPFVGPLVGVITGHIGLAQIKRSGEKGRGLALTGVILGWVNIALIVISIALFFTFFLATSSSYRY